MIIWKLNNRKIFVTLFFVFMNAPVNNVHPNFFSAQEQSELLKQC